MKDIRKALETLDHTVEQRLLPTQIFKIGDIPADPEITSAYESVAAKFPLGRQYDWLARLARSQEVTLELGVHRDDKFHDVLGEEVRPTQSGSYSIAGTSDPNLTVFSNFEFPIFNMTKVEMQEQAQKYVVGVPCRSPVFM